MNDNQQHVALIGLDFYISDINVTAGIVNTLSKSHMKWNRETYMTESSIEDSKGLYFTDIFPLFAKFKHVTFWAARRR